VLAVLLALASAIGYGGSDFAAGLAARRTGVLLVTFLATMSSLILTLLVLPWLVTSGPSVAGLAWGAAAGLGGMTGALALYAGFRHAAFSVAAPLSAVTAAGLSVIVGIALGERPSALSLAGIAVALPAIVLVSLTAAPPGPSEPRHRPSKTPPGPGEPAPSAAPRRALRPPFRRAARGQHRGAMAGVTYGLAAGTGFALLFVGLNRAGSRAGIWPVIAGQAAEVAVLVCIAVASGALRADLRAAFGGTVRAPTGLAVITGLTGGGATILYFFATHDGFLAITAVLTSLYPAVTIGLARLLASERLSATRLSGLVLAGMSVTLIALGGTG
jgi:drug/metabolite transporter (DMT)-like permease